MSKQTMTPAEYKSRAKRPAKMAPQGKTSEDSRIKQLEREVKALWEAHSLLQCDINKLKGGSDD